MLVIYRGASIITEGLFVCRISELLSFEITTASDEEQSREKEEAGSYSHKLL